MWINASINLLVTEQSSWLCLEIFFILRSEMGQKVFSTVIGGKEEQLNPGADGVIIMKSLM